MFFCLSNWFPQELEQQFEKERLSLEEQKTTLRQQLDELKGELTSKLTAATEEVEKSVIVMCDRYRICFGPHAPVRSWHQVPL